MNKENDKYLQGSRIKNKIVDLLKTVNNEYNLKVLDWQGKATVKEK